MVSWSKLFFGAASSDVSDSFVKETSQKFRDQLRQAIGAGVVSSDPDAPKASRDHSGKPVVSIGFFLLGLVAKDFGDGDKFKSIASELEVACDEVQKVYLNVSKAMAAIDSVG